MTESVQITFRDMEPSEAVAQSIREKAEKLRRHHDPILDCHVVVETPHKHHHKGRVHHVRVHVKVPGGEFDVDRDPADHGHEDVYVAIRDAFEAIHRQLDTFREKQRGRVKQH